MSARLRNAWVFAGGEFSVGHVPADEMQTEDLYIGVDSGIEHCLSCDVVPDMLIGDFDSVDQQILHDPRLTNVPRRSFSARKANSDLDLALNALLTEQIAHATIFGVSGGRTDHMLFNWMLPLSRRWPFSIRLIDDTVDARIVTSEYPLDCILKLNQLVSLVALSDTEGVTTQGLGYPLVNASLPAGSTLGLSNLVSEPIVKVSIVSGVVLAMLVHSLS